MDIQILPENKISFSASKIQNFLIEVRWLWLQRQAINNSTFKDKQEIGKAVSKWKNIYNKKHGIAITNVLQESIPLCLHSC